MVISTFDPPIFATLASTRISSPLPNCSVQVEVAPTLFLELLGAGSRRRRILTGQLPLCQREHLRLQIVSTHGLGG
jgi:hypothetical protein